MHSSPFSPSTSPRLHLRPRAPFLAGEFFSIDKRFLFVVGGGGVDGEFPEVGLMSVKLAVVEVEGESGGRERVVVLVTIVDGHKNGGGR